MPNLRHRRIPRSPVLIDGAAADAARVGHKFARQAEMAKAGLPVPPFYCVATSAFDEALAPVRARLDVALKDAEDADDLRDASDEVRAVVASASIPAGVLRDVLAAFDARFGPDGIVAVRSSMVSSDPDGGEDSASNPFAGMGDSFLYVERDGVADAIRACWASPFKPEAMLYMRSRGIDWHGIGVAVGVQQMVLGERSFVLFTCNPLTGGRDPVIAAGLGIGEGVVQERVAVDHFFYDRANDDIASTVVEKPTMLTREPGDAAPGGASIPRLAELPVPEQRRSRPALADGEIRRLVAIGDRIERLFGSAQDVEGTIAADGAISIVQARPVAFDRRQRRLWSNANVTESFPGVTTALTYSFARWFYDADFGDLQRRLGVRRVALRQHARELPGMIGFLHGRIYYSLSAWYALFRLNPLFPAYRGDWERMMGMSVVPEDETDSLRRPGERLVTSALRLVVPAATLLRLVLRHEREMRAFDAWWGATIEGARRNDLAALDELQLKAEFDAVWRQVVVRWGVTLVNDLLIAVSQRLIAHLMERWVPDAPDGLLTDLLCGGPEPRSVAAVMSAVSLAERVRAQPALREAFGSSSPRSLWEAIRRGDHGAEIRDAFDDHLSAFGDRGLQELKMEQPSTRDAPWELVSLVGAYAQGDATVAALRAREREIRARAEALLAERLGTTSVRRLVLRRLAERVRRYVRHREDSRYSRSELFGFARQVFTAIGSRLAEAGTIDHASDVQHLTVDELFGHADGTGTLANLGALAALRRAEHERPGEPLPMHFSTLGPVGQRLPAPRGASGPGATQLRGLGSSAGRVQGTACVVVEPAEIGPIPGDAVLVARETDPGWLFLMLQAKAMVVERGTLLSHTAITGRLFGIPTVVGVPEATTAIPDGARVEVDGGAGVVRLLAAGDGDPTTGGDR